jgi:TolB-like protein/Flp pilus assembly protein TadD
MDGLSSFEGFRLDRHGLFRVDEAGAAAPVAIGPRAFDLLSFLVRHNGELVSKDQIMDAVWPGIVVGEGNLTVQISALRRILDRNPTRGSCIQTIAGRGYRFVGPLKQPERDPHCAILVAPEKAARPRLSIVVLPFTNLSDDREQQYFADGIAEDLTTDLSRIPGMFVISRNTAFTYRNRRVETKQIGRELGVSYVLEGSVRRARNHVRVNAQLIDTETAAHLWAERFDGDTGDLFALQNEVTSRIAIALDVELIAAEAARPTDNPDALEYILRGRAAMMKPLTRDSHAAAIGVYERALALDPGSVEAQSLLASALASRVLEGMTDSRAADIGRAEGLAGQALAASPRSPLPHFATGQVLRAQGRFEEALPEYETAIALDPNWVTAISSLADCKLYTGAIEEVIPLQEQAIRLSPRDPYIGNMYGRIGRVHLVQSRIDEAIRWYEKAIRANPARSGPHAYLASAYALNGWTDRAAAELAEARRLVSDDRYSSIARLSATLYFGMPNPRSLFEATYFAGLRKAGMPEE